MATKQEVVEIRAALIQEKIRRWLGPEHVTGFYIGIAAMMVAPELWRSIMDDIEHVPEKSDRAALARQALEQASEHTRTAYADICAATPEASS